MISPKLLTIIAGGLIAVALAAAVLEPIFAHPRGGSRKQASPAWEARRAEQDKIRKAGHEALFGGDYRAAIAEYRRLLSLNPNSVEAYLEIAKAYDALGQPREALENFRLAWDAPRRFSFKIVSPFESLRYGQLALDAGDPATARRAFVRTIEDSGDTGGLLTRSDLEQSSLSVLHGIACAAAMHYFPMEKWLITARKAYALAPNSAFVCSVYAGELCVMRQYKDSRAMYERALNLVSGEAHEKLAEYVRNNGFLSTTRIITSTDAKGRAHSHPITIELKNEPYPNLPQLPARTGSSRPTPIQP